MTPYESPQQIIGRTAKACHPKMVLQQCGDRLLAPSRWQQLLAARPLQRLLLFIFYFKNPSPQIPHYFAKAKARHLPLQAGAPSHLEPLRLQARARKVGRQNSPPPDLLKGLTAPPSSTPLNPSWAPNSNSPTRPIRRGASELLPISPSPDDLCIVKSMHHRRLQPLRRGRS